MGRVSSPHILMECLKYPFWQMTLANENAVYACINYREASCPIEIANRSICMDGDIGDVFAKVKQ